MATVRSNLPTIARAITELPELLRLDRTRGKGRTFGEDLLELISARIIRMAILEQKMPDGQPFPPLNPKYARSKRKRGYPIGILDFEMLQQEQVRGRREIYSHVASMTFGKSARAILKAEWFQEGFRGRDRLGRRQNRPKRPFYEMDAIALKALDDACEARLDEGIRDLGGE